MQTVIEFKNVMKSYDDKLVLRNISLVIHKGDFITLIGPSGCGKTTLLRMINAMTPYDAGNIMVMGKDLKEWNKIELRRKTGYVIQQGGLFPHLTIRENIEFVLKLSDISRKSIDSKVKELSEMMGFDHQQLEAYPQNLSGGQQQRVGVARALSADPQIVLMDEPFGALDNITRRHLQNEVKEMHQKTGLTFVFVTHDIREAFHLGSKVVIMNQGIIKQFDTPEQIKSNPANSWVSDFTKQI
ncbi:MAG: ATP-binding cassette domain-containing protein [Bacteroidota bacterium]